jgi:hypothetical protein
VLLSGSASRHAWFSFTIGTVFYVDFSLPACKRFLVQCHKESRAGLAAASLLLFKRFPAQVFVLAWFFGLSVSLGAPRDLFVVLNFSFLCCSVFGRSAVQLTPHLT